jgi:site-specific DNA-methyltransferase (adenine-specific)
LLQRTWDAIVPGVDAWAQALRVAKSGAYLLAFGSTRTMHRLMIAIEDAGWEIRDQIAWHYASGFPKSPAALKPAMELIVLARKPLRGTVAENVQQYGTGALNIDACRVDGRWPMNVLHDGSDEAISGMRDDWKYYFSAKASRADRDDGCDDLPLRRSSSIEARNRESNLGQFDGPTPMGRNYHPTVKPTALMTYLCRLVTPPGGVVLDPFCGSGSTGRGALIAGASRFVGIDQDSEYIEIARRRIEAARLPLDAHWSAE